MLTQERARIYQHERWEADIGRRELRAHGIPIPIGGRAFDILAALVEADGQLVTKDELMARVWSRTIVEESVLYVHISAIRKALGTDRGMLKMAFGRGYRRRSGAMVDAKRAFLTTKAMTQYLSTGFQTIRWSALADVEMLGAVMRAYYPGVSSPHYQTVCPAAGAGEGASPI
jgi:DNA-binding winged helix-turn-helix (wHTH) protein